MPNYQDGYIYKIWSLQTEEIYIGSSTTEPRKRLCGHKKKYKRFLKGHKIYVSSFEIVKYPHCKIEIIEKYPCNSKAELCKREGEHQRATKCCNRNIAGRTKKEYYENNIENIAKQKKEYNEKKINKDNKKNYDKEYYKNNKDKRLKRDRERYQEKKKEKEKSNIKFLKIKIIKKV